jgi:hypothetical protein
MSESNQNPSKPALPLKTGQVIAIHSTDFFFKVTEFLQQNWAVIEPEENTVKVYFIDDASNLFDVMSFDSIQHAERGLRANRFRRLADEYEDDEQPKYRLRHPEAPYTVMPRPIYSTGEYWRLPTRY